MNFELSQEEQKILDEFRVLVKDETTPELLAETRELGGIYGGTEGRKFVQKMGARGWLCSHWPEQYGGLGTSEMVGYLLRDEMAHAGLPAAFVAAAMAGPTIKRFGSEELKDEWLPRIARGEVEFALGYSEPNAGSDLSALAIKAEDEGDNFRINGQKIFNTHTHVADYHWLAARTDPDAKKHKGVSLMIVDLKSPGVTVRPMVTMAGWQTNVVYYDDVIVPKKNMCGEKNRGFYYLMAALDFERMFPPGGYRKHFEDIVEYAKETVVDGEPLSKKPLVRQKLAQMAIEFEAAKLLFYQLPHILDKGQIPNYQSSMEKLFATELAQKISIIGMEILGLHGQLKQDSKWAQLAGRAEHYYQWSVVETIYAGTSEIQRNIMATRGLEMPR
jgi:alkylation response protein AidB-like acyl-CoA dehydrogenase